MDLNLLEGGDQMKEVLCKCKSKLCQKEIHRGDIVWAMSRRLFCTIKCAVESLKENSPAATGLRTLN